MIKCNSCWVDNNDWVDFCSSCWAKIWELNINDKKEDAADKVKWFIDEIAKNEKSKKLLWYFKWLDRNQKIISWISILLIIGFFLPYLWGDSLFSFGWYVWILFIIPMLVLAIQYCYSVLKIDKYHKILWLIIVLVLSTIVTTFNLVIYFALDAFSDFLRMMWGDIELSIWYIVSLFGFVWVFVLAILEILSIVKNESK